MLGTTLEQRPYLLRLRSGRKWVCQDIDAAAATREYDTEKPKTIQCTKSFYKGSIEPGVGNAPSVSCRDFYPRPSTWVETLGTILLHEYTHWDRLVMPSLTSRVVDHECHHGAVRTMPKSFATTMADSYGWLATEVF